MSRARQTHEAGAERGEISWGPRRTPGASAMRGNRGSTVDGRTWQPTRSPRTRAPATWRAPGVVPTNEAASARISHPEVMGSIPCRALS